MTNPSNAVDLGALQREVDRTWLDYVAAKRRLEAEEDKIYRAIQEMQKPWMPRFPA